MDLSTKAMDISVEITNVYNTCQLDYIMQAWAPIFTSMSGFLGFSASLLNIVLSGDYVSTYEGMSLAAYNRDSANAGLYMGSLLKNLWGVELEDATI